MLGKYHWHLLSVVLLIFLFSCKEEVIHNDILESAKMKIKNAQSLSYTYSADWDNQFNETTFIDTAVLILSQLENEHMIYGVYAIARGDEFIFSGDRYTEILHSDSSILNRYQSAMNVHPKDVMSNSFMMHVPLDIVEMDSLDYLTDEVIEDKKYVVFRSTKTSPSVADSNIVMTYHTDHYIGIDSFNYDRVVSTSIRGTDTLQVIEIKFENIIYEDVMYDFNVTDRLLNYDYKVVSKFAEDVERDALSVDEGDQIVYQSFVDVVGDNVVITKPNRTSVIMFSFIGCGGCEIAMKKLKDRNMEFDENIDFYYSSPVDRSEVLMRYLEKKKFESMAFGSESKMNDHFQVFSYPTFVVLDDKCVVRSIEFGYDDNIEQLLFRK